MKPLVVLVSFFLLSFSSLLAEDINVRNEYGFTALGLAVRNCQVDEIQSLIKRGANVNAGLNESFSPLMLAVYHKCRGAVEPLLKAGADVNFRDPASKLTNLVSVIGKYENREFGVTLLPLFIEKGLDLCLSFNSTEVSILFDKLKRERVRVSDAVEDKLFFYSRYDVYKAICVDGEDQREWIAIGNLGRGKAFNPCHISWKKWKKLISSYRRVQDEAERRIRRGEIVLNYSNVDIEKYKDYKSKSKHKRLCAEEVHPESAVGDREVDNGDGKRFGKPSAGRRSTSGAAGKTNGSSSRRQ